MQDREIISGFTEIKIELRNKTRTNKSMQELALWFTYHDGVLYVHDYDEHEKCMVLSILAKPMDQIKIYLKEGSIGERLVQYFYVESERKGQNLAVFANELYLLHGFKAFGRF